MKNACVLLAVAALAVFSGCSPDLHGPWPKPELAAHAAAVPTDADALADELALGQKNYFALQEYYLGMGEVGASKKRQRVHELTLEEAAWVDAAVAAESQALGRLLPPMEKALNGKVAAVDRPAPEVPRVSLAIMSRNSAGTWDIAQARSNLAGYLAYIHRLRRSKRADPAQLTQALVWARQGREELARFEQAPPPTANR